MVDKTGLGWMFTDAGERVRVLGKDEASAWVVERVDVLRTPRRTLPASHPYLARLMRELEKLTGARAAGSSAAPTTGAPPFSPLAPPL